MVLDSASYRTALPWAPARVPVVELAEVTNLIVRAAAVAFTVGVLADTPNVARSPPPSLEAPHEGQNRLPVFRGLHDRCGAPTHGDIDPCWKYGSADLAAKAYVRPTEQPT